MSAPRDNLIREMPFEVTRTEEDGDGLTFEGYAAVWDSPTEINSRSEGNFIETMKRGAFKRTTNAKMPVFMFDHGQHPLFGSMPLGVIQEAREDNRGLFIRARFSDNWLIQPIRDACAEGAIPGMSFRMSIPEGGETWRPARGGKLAERDITEVKCPELGPVVFPAYEETSVGVRSQEVLDALGDEEVLADLARALFRADTQSDPAAYADPGYKDDKVKRYPINTQAHVKAAWAYINMDRNQQGYTPEQVASIKGRIKAAAKKFGVTVDEQKSTEPEGQTRDLFDEIEHAIQDVHPGLSLSNFDEGRAECFDGDDLIEVQFSRDDDGNVTVAEINPEPAEGTSGVTPEPADEVTPALDPTDEVTPRGANASDAETARFLRQLKARDLLGA